MNYYLFGTLEKCSSIIEEVYYTREDVEKRINTETWADGKPIVIKGMRLGMRISLEED
jgi:hypothetical protein